MAGTLEQFDHAAWRTTIGMLISYVSILVAITIVFFALPYLIFLAL